MNRPFVASAEIAGPFKVYSNPFRIKAEDRTPFVAGEQITPVAVQASSSQPQTEATRIVDRNGLQDKDNDGLLEHGTDRRHMWLSEKGQTTGWIEFDLGQPRKLGTIRVWNYNENWQTKRGVKKADISVWTQDAGWKKMHDDLPLEEAEGSDDYDEPVLVKLDGIAAQKVRLDDMANFGDTEHIGLSEVQLFEVRGPTAVQPKPADGAVGVGVAGLALQWMPGLDAVAHKVYLGTDPDKLELLGQVEDASTARLSRLARDTTYYWRIDEVQADRSAVKSKVWSFRTGGLLGWWKLDESEGSNASDSSGNNLVAKLMGNPQWQPSGGKVGGALQFDGVDDSVETDYATDLPVWTVAVWVNSPAAPSSEVPSGPVHRQQNYQMNWNHTSDDFRGAAGVSVEGQWHAASFGKLEADTWYHLTATYDGENLKAFKDSVLITTNSAPSGKPDAESASLKFGRHSAFTDYFRGTIDDVRIYSCALNEADVAALYSGEDLPVEVVKVTLKAPEKPQEKRRKLVAWWKLDETEGSNVADSSGNNLAGTVVGNPQWQPAGGKVGGALHLDGDGDYVGIEDELALDITDAITVAAWVKVNAFDKDFQAIVTKGDSAWRLQRFTNTNCMEFACSGVDAEGTQWGNIGGSATVSDGQWHHVAGVYDGEKLYIYVDGALDNSKQASGTIATNDHSVLIGANAEKPDEDYRTWNGLIDDVCVFNYALSADEVAALCSGKEPLVIAGVELPSTLGTGTNWIPVLIIIAIAGVAVGFANRRKKARA